MARGVLYVESRPASPEQTAEYHKWYDETHIPQVLALDGFVSARRLDAGDGESFVALYDIEADDVDAAVAGLNAAMGNGTVELSSTIGLDPAPVMRVLKDRTG
ncbi:hypothetical protein [Yinghuangia sp. YIM S10712]|uniref:hypothetical protein n=1 Tax=Yinghuangia sp. YIM S10712 TaxID=3436930 RepID=UPI003F53C3EB